MLLYVESQMHANMNCHLSLSKKLYLHRKNKLFVIKFLSIRKPYSDTCFFIKSQAEYRESVYAPVYALKQSIESFQPWIFSNQLAKTKINTTQDRSPPNNAILSITLRLTERGLEMFPRFHQRTIGNPLHCPSSKARETSSTT